MGYRSFFCFRDRQTIESIFVEMVANGTVENITLDNLQTELGSNQLKIFAINVSKEKKEKVNKFFIDLNIKNFNPYFDPPITLAKTFSLRGIPTSILFNKDSQEFARIIGSIDFEDKEFVNWIKKYY